MLKLLCALLVAALAGCFAPAQHPSAARPRAALRVQLGLWDSYNRELFHEAAHAAALAGVAVRVGPGGPGAVRLIHGDLAAADGRCLRHALYDSARRTIVFDPSCTPGRLLRVHVALHELLHAAGGEHVCEYPGQLPDAMHPDERCSPVGYGHAVLNPYPVPAPRFDPSANAAADPYDPGAEPTDLDRAEIARAAGARD